MIKSFNKFLFFVKLLVKNYVIICVGRYIHYIYRNQDIRFYYGIYYIYPLNNYYFFNFKCGFPFLVGYYYSKNLIIESFFFKKNNFSIINLIVGTIFTISYSFHIILVVTRK